MSELVQYDRGTGEVTCPFDGCDWSDFTAPGPDMHMHAEDIAIRHYEREHAGKCRIRVVLESERLLREGTLQERIDSAHDRWDGTDVGVGWEVAYVLGEVVQEADDHEEMEVQR